VEVEAGYGLVVQDLKKLGQVTDMCQRNIGSSSHQSLDNKTTLWSSLTALQGTVLSVNTSLKGQAAQLGEISLQQMTLTQMVSTLEDTADYISSSVDSKVQLLEKDLRSVEQRMLKLLPLLHQLKGSRGSTISNSGDQYAQIHNRLDEFAQRLQDLQELVCDQMLAPTSTPRGPASVKVPVSPPPTLTPSSSELSEVMSQLRTVQT